MLTISESINKSNYFIFGGQYATANDEFINNTFLSDEKAKDVLLDLMVKELVIRLLQTKAKLMLLAFNWEHNASTCFLV